MYCTRCGTAVQDGAAYCRSCGQPVGGEKSAVSVGAENPGAKDTELSVPETVPAVFPTPAEQDALRFAPTPTIAYAGFWLRVVAYLIDGAVLGVVFGLIVAIVVATTGSGFWRGFASGAYGRGASLVLPPATLAVLFILLPITVVVTWLYFVLMETSVHQATLGKMALGLYVADLQGRRISFGCATGRFFAKIVTGLVPLFIGYLMAGFTSKKQALHDMIAGCVVLKKV